jgi:ubiquinone/menaquinone biosynthesis C-methylase UbiE
MPNNIECVRAARLNSACNLPESLRSMATEAAMADVRQMGASATWRSVDDGAASAIGYLDRLTTEIADTKARVTALLRLVPGQAALEAGCGLGRDTEVMARQVMPGGYAVGLDLSEKLIGQAVARTAPLGLPLRFEVGSVTALPFPDASFDAVRIERTLQHLSEPTQALAELARVLRHGGRFAVLEPDWHTTVVAGGPMEVMRTYVRQKADQSIAQGGIGRDLPWLLRQAGCTVTDVNGEVLVMRTLASADFVLSLRDSLASAAAAEAVTPEAADLWWAALEERDRTGTFYASINGVVVGATRE